MKRKHIFLGVLLIISSSLLVLGCDFHESEGVSYEILSFEEVPEVVQDGIREVHRMIVDGEREEDTRLGTEATGSYNLGKDGRYEYFITTNNQTLKIIEVVTDEAFGSGLKIVFTTEDREEGVEFPSNVRIVKFNEYHERIAHLYITSPQ